MGRGNPKRVEVVLKALQINHLMLYPRIRQEVRDSLDKVDIEVYDKEICLTPKMEQIQSLLIKVISSCNEELKFQLKSHNLSDDFFTVEKALTKSFEGALK